MRRRRLVFFALLAAAACGRTQPDGRGSTLLQTDGDPDPGSGGDPGGGDNVTPGDVQEICYDGPCGPCDTDANCASCERCVSGTCHIAPIVQLYTGHRSTCFLDDLGGRWCVGEGNGVGEPPGTAPNMPVHLSGDDGYTRLALGWSGGFGQQNAQLVQWTDVSAPTFYSSDTTWVDFLDDRDDYCFRHADGTAMCDEQDEGGGWDVIDPAANHECGIKSGTIYCWGTDLSNVLGQGVEPDDTFIASPTAVGTDADWATVSISDTLACALKTNGTLWCWGAADATGTNGVDTAGVPTQISTDTDWMWLDVAWDHACAGKAGGHVFCWGTDGFGLEILPGQTTVLVPSEMGQTWDDIRLGGHHYCGQSGGKWYCWGWNAAGQLGLGDAITTNAPTRALCVPPPPG